MPQRALKMGVTDSLHAGVGDKLWGGMVTSTRCCDCFASAVAKENDKNSAMPGAGARPRSFSRRFGSIFGSRRAFATSKTCSPSAELPVSCETVRRWVNHLGPIIAADLRKRRPKPLSIWRLDEVYLKIDSRMSICGAPSTPKARTSTCWSNRSERSAPR